MPREEIIENFESAEELIDALGRRYPRWGVVPQAWVFRGHADAAWPLLPAALRTPCPVTHHPHRDANPYQKTYDQIGQEIEKVMDFINYSNYCGLPIPGDASRIIRLLSEDRYHAKTKMYTWEQFPSAETLEAFALAQHHGIPTRLLDWSRNPLVAAYFAGVNAARKLNEKKEVSARLGIWCFRFDYAPAFTSDSDDKIYMVDPPRAPNRNLLAQNGIFTLHVHRLRPDDDTKAEPFDELVHRLCKTSPVSQLTKQIRLMTLPVTQSRKLLVCLAQEDITAAKLFPGYDGVVRELSESLNLRQSWRCPPETE